MFREFSGWGTKAWGDPHPLRGLWAGGSRSAWGLGRPFWALLCVLTYISAQKLLPPPSQHVGGWKSQLQAQAKGSTRKAQLRENRHWARRAFRAGRRLLGVWKAMWAGGWMLPCPKAPTPVRGIPSPAAGTASCILGVQEEAHQRVWGTAESLRGCRVSRCSGHRRMLRLRRKERSKPCLGIGVWSRGGAGCSTRLHSACGEAGGGQGRWPAVFAGRGLEFIKAAL